MTQQDDLLQLTLVSQENDEFMVLYKAAKISTFIVSCADVENTTIPVPQLTSMTLAKCIEFMNYYMDNPMSEIPKVFFLILV